MKSFKVERVAQLEFDDAAGWYEREREGLGLEFIESVDRTLAQIETQERFVTSPLATFEDAVVRREFVHRFPYVVIFVDRYCSPGDHDPPRQRQPGALEIAYLAAFAMDRATSARKQKRPGAEASGR